ncbi:MAG: hypothetical protein H6995_02180 [Pseudomonadales bacterium]|nr:hypothetical protein [Pseudomonadales bacterium]
MHKPNEHPPAKHPYEFVPITDDVLDQHPELLFNLVPYQRDYPCHRELADTSPVKINRAGLAANEVLQLPLFQTQAKDG